MGKSTTKLQINLGLRKLDERVEDDLIVKSSFSEALIISWGQAFQPGCSGRHCETTRFGQAKSLAPHYSR